MKIKNQNIYGGNNQFAKTIINNASSLNEVDKKLIELIKIEIPDEKKRSELLNDLLKVKDSSSAENETQAKKNLKEFFKSVSSQSGKELAKQLIEEGSSLINSIL